MFLEVLGTAGLDAALGSLSTATEIQSALVDPRCYCSNIYRLSKPNPDPNVTTVLGSNPENQSANSINLTYSSASIEGTSPDPGTAQSAA